MTVEIFWQLIEKARNTAGTNDKAFASALQTELESLSEEDLLLFQEMPSQKSKYKEKLRRN